MTEHRAPTTGLDDGPATGPVAVPVAASDPGTAGAGGKRTDMRAALEEADRGCEHCGATEAPRHGECPACGRPRALARDHLEFTLGACAGLTDRGLRRPRNEDAVALGRVDTPAGELLVGVVCDGVASARRGDEASLAAVEGAVDAVLDAMARGTAGALDDFGALAAAGAAESAARLGRDGGAADAADPPACTYVGAVVRAGSAVVSWVGDSRIYWLASDGTSQLLSTDDSWAEEIAAAGLMTREQAHTDRRAHVLTRWLGRDSPPGPARARRFRPAAPGLLLLCSDGLWNHIPAADDLAALVDPPDAAGTADSGDTLAAARALVAAALDDGGYDNATVALLPVVPSSGDGEWGRPPEQDTGPVAVEPGADAGRGADDVTGRSDR